MAAELPVAKFQRFERVRVAGEPPHYPELRGRSGTVLWRDSYQFREPRPHLPSMCGWLYLVFFPTENAYRTLPEHILQAEGTFDPESVHLGVRPEFSIDVIMEDDMTWVEGTYRLPGKFWEVMIFGKADVPELRHRPNKPPIEWASGITGTIFTVPRTAQLNRDYVRKALVTVFGHEDWTEVLGPDSMVLR